MLKIFVYVALISTLMSCASMDRFESGDQEYFASVKQYSDRKEYYHGLMNVFQMQGTILNSKVLSGQLIKKSNAFNWSDEQIKEEQTKNDNSLRGETNVFLS